MTESAPHSAYTPLLINTTLLVVMVALLASARGGPTAGAMTALVIAMSLTQVALVALAARRHKARLTA